MSSQSLKQYTYMTCSSRTKNHLYLYYKISKSLFVKLGEGSYNKARCEKIEIIWCIPPIFQTISKSFLNYRHLNKTAKTSFLQMKII